MNSQRCNFIKLLASFALGLGGAVLLPLSSAIAAATNYQDPAGYAVSWPTNWVPYTVNGGNLRDDTGDGTNGGTQPQQSANISPCPSQLASVFFHRDANNFYFRLCLAADPYQSSNGPYDSSTTWSILIDVNGDGYRDFVVMLDGKKDPAFDVVPDNLYVLYKNDKRQDFVNSDIQIGSGASASPGNAVLWVQDSAKGTSASTVEGESNWDIPVPTTSTYVQDFKRTRITKNSDGSTYFLDIQVPLAAFDAASKGGPTLTASSPLAFAYSTANSNTDPIQKDFTYVGNFTVNPANPLPFGDTTTGNSTFPQPSLIGLSATGCGATTLSATVQDSLNTNGSSSVNKVEFFYQFDSDGNNQPDLNGSWTSIGNASLATNTSNPWQLSWNTTSLLKGKYFIKAVATDNGVDGIASTAVDNYTTDSTDALDGTGDNTPSGGDRYNPATLGTTPVLATLDNTCGVTPQPPTIDLDGNNSSGATGNNFTTNFTLGSSAVKVVDSNTPDETQDTVINDPDSTQLSRAVINLTNAQTGDQLSVNGSLPTGISIDSANSTSTKIVLVGNASLANYESALEQIQFTTTSTITSDRLLNITVTDTNNQNSNTAVSTVKITVPVTTNISGTLYLDRNADNSFNSGDTNLPANVTVKLLDSAGTTTLTTTTTNASGQYNFTGVVNGSYKIQVDTTDSDIPAGYALTTANNVAVTISGADISNINFGFQSPKISGYKSIKLTNDADSSTTVTPGDTLNWTLSYANTGSIDVSNFQVTDALPSGVKIAGTPTISANATQGTAPTANTSYNGAGTNTLFNSPVVLKAGGVITALIPVTIDSGVTGIKSNQATGNGSNLVAGINTDNIDNTTSGLPAGVTVPTNSINQTQTASIDPTTVNVLAPTADLSINKTDGQTNTTQGSSITYTITVTNKGSSTVNSVKVTDTVPASIQNPTFTASSGSYNSSTGDWTGLNLASGQSVTLTLKGTVSSTATGTITNTATVTPPAGTTDSDSTNNSSTDTTSVNPAADLSITKTDSPDPVYAGANLTYAIAVTNNGSSTATNATMNDPLPSGTTFQSITAPSGWSCTTPAVGSNGTVNCTNPSFAVGSATFTVVVKVDPDTANATTLNNTATVSSSTADTNTGNNSSSQTTTVQQSADLKLTKVANPASPQVGASFDYIITVTNDGPSTATNVKVKDQLPTGVIYATNLLDTSSQGTYDRGTGEWGVGTLNPGASATLTIKAIRNVVGNTVNTAEVIAADQPDPDSLHNNHVVGEDDQDSVTVPSESVDLAVTKTVDNSTPTVGQNVTFTVKVTNPLTSTVAATNIGLTDVLPAGLTYQSDTVSPGTTYNTGSGVWSIGTLNRGTTATLTITAKVTTSGAKTNTAQLSALDQTDSDTANNTASATVTASSLKPNLLLVKRITAINGNKTKNPNDNTPLNTFVNDPTTADDNSYWSTPSTYLIGAYNGGKVKPGDEVEYTIYFLNTEAAAKNVTLCDRIPDNMTLVPTGYNSASPHPTESGAIPSDTGIGFALNASTLPTNPTVYLTNVNDSDRGRYYPPYDPNTPSTCKVLDAQGNQTASGAAANTNGAVVVEVVKNTDAVNQLPPATSAGTPTNSYGFIRFKAKVN